MKDPFRALKTTANIATSLDGFIARLDGSLDWLPGADGSETTEDYGFQAFLDTVDALVMGRHTFEKVLTFGQWPYHVPVVVLSSRPVEIPGALRQGVEWLCCAPSEVVDQLGLRGVEHLYVDGGVTIQRFLSAGLIQRVIITRVPVLIGSGIPLFGQLPHDLLLRHIQTRSYPTGLVQSEYEVTV